MVKIKELHLQHFRAFSDACLPLDERLTVLVGANGSGKSTLITAFKFLQEAVASSLLDAIDSNKGIKNIRQRQAGRGKSYDLQVGLKLNVDGVALIYSFKIGASGSQIVIKSEDLIVEGDSAAGYSRTGNKLVNSIKGIAPVLSSDQLLLKTVAAQRPLWLAAYQAIAGIRTYHLNPAALQTEVRVEDVTWLRENGDNAANVLRYLERSQPSRVQWIVDFLDKITSGIVRIQTETTDTGLRWIILNQRTNESTTHKYTAAQMSDGTVRALGLLLALQQQPRPSLIVIDEVEDSIHVSALGVLIDALSEASEWCQVMITSHSTELLSFEEITPERTRLVRWTEGISTIHRLRPAAFKVGTNGNHADEPDYSVGELFRSNAINLAAERQPLVATVQATRR